MTLTAGEDKVDGRQSLDIRPQKSLDILVVIAFYRLEFIEGDIALPARLFQVLKDFGQ